MEKLTNVPITRIQEYEVQLNTIYKDVQKLIQASKNHGDKIKELMVTASSSVSQVEFMTAFATAQYKNATQVKSIKSSFSTKSGKKEEVSIVDDRESREIKAIQTQLQNIESDIFNKNFKSQMDMKKIEKEIKVNQKDFFEVKGMINHLGNKLSVLLQDIKNHGVATKVDFNEFKNRKNLLRKFSLFDTPMKDGDISTDSKPEDASGGVATLEDEREDKAPQSEESSRKSSVFNVYQQDSFNELEGNEGEELRNGREERNKNGSRNDAPSSVSNSYHDQDSGGALNMAPFSSSQSSTNPFIGNEIKRSIYRESNQGEGEAGWKEAQKSMDFADYLKKKSKLMNQTGKASKFGAPIKPQPRVALSAPNTGDGITTHSSSESTSIQKEEVVSSSMDIYDYEVQGLQDLVLGQFGSQERKELDEQQLQHLFKVDARRRNFEFFHRVKAVKEIELVANRTSFESMVSALSSFEEKSHEAFKSVLADSLGSSVGQSGIHRDFTAGGGLSMDSEAVSRKNSSQSMAESITLGTSPTLSGKRSSSISRRESLFSDIKNRLSQQSLSIANVSAPSSRRPSVLKKMDLGEKLGVLETDLGDIKEESTLGLKENDMSFLDDSEDDEEEKGSGVLNTKGFFGSRSSVSSPKDMHVRPYHYSRTRKISEGQEDENEELESRKSRGHTAIGSDHDAGSSSSSRSANSKRYTEELLDGDISMDSAVANQVQKKTIENIPSHPSWDEEEEYMHRRRSGPNQMGTTEGMGPESPKRALSHLSDSSMFLQLDKVTEPSYSIMSTEISMSDADRYQLKQDIKKIVDKKLTKLFETLSKRIQNVEQRQMQITGHINTSILKKLNAFQDMHVESENAISQLEDSIYNAELQIQQIGSRLEASIDPLVDAGEEAHKNFQQLESFIFELEDKFWKAHHNTMDRVKELQQALSNQKEGKEEGKSDGVKGVIYEDFIKLANETQKDLIESSKKLKDYSMKYQEMVQKIDLIEAMSHSKTHAVIHSNNSPNDRHQGSSFNKGYQKELSDKKDRDLKAREFQKMLASSELGGNVEIVKLKTDVLQLMQLVEKQEKSIDFLRKALKDKERVLPDLARAESVPKEKVSKPPTSQKTEGASAFHSSWTDGQYNHSPRQLFRSGPPRGTTPSSQRLETQRTMIPMSPDVHYRSSSPGYENSADLVSPFSPFISPTPPVGKHTQASVFKSPKAINTSKTFYNYKQIQARRVLPDNLKNILGKYRDEVWHKPYKAPPEGLKLGASLDSEIGQSSPIDFFDSTELNRFSGSGVDKELSSRSYFEPIDQENDGLVHASNGSNSLSDKPSISQYDPIVQEEPIGVKKSIRIQNHAFDSSYRLEVDRIQVDPYPLAVQSSATLARLGTASPANPNRTQSPSGLNPSSSANASKEGSREPTPSAKVILPGVKKWEEQGGGIISNQGMESDDESATSSQGGIDLSQKATKTST